MDIVDLVSLQAVKDLIHELHPEDDSMKVENLDGIEAEDLTQSHVGIFDVLPEDVTSLGTDEMKKLYHQTFISSVDGEGGMWRLPVKPLYVENYALQYHGLHHPIALEFYHNCQVIQNCWELDASQCIPSMLRTKTPYSLTLFSKLRTWAKRTAHMPGMAHAMLTEIFNHRISRLDGSEHHYVSLMETVKTSTDPSDMVLEDKIVENIFGLTVQDVSTALDLFTEEQLAAGIASSKKARKARKVSRRQQALINRELKNGGDWMSVAERVVERRRADDKTTKRTKTPNNGQDELMEVEMGESRPATDQRGYEFESNAGSSAFQGGEHKKEADQRKASLEDRQICNRLRRIHVVMNKERTPCKRKRNQFAKGGFSGQNRDHNGKRLMPSEQTNIQSMQPLHSLFSPTDKSLLDRLGQLSLPG